MNFGFSEEQNLLRGSAHAVGGGTPNIQRNIISERILGQPKD